jgi:cell division protein ZapA
VKRSVTVQVAGQRYTLKTDDDDRLVKSLAAYVDAKFRDVQRSSRNPDTQAVAILTALQVAEELFQTRQQAAEMKQEAAEVKKNVREKARTLLDYLAKVGRV